MLVTKAMFSQLYELMIRLDVNVAIRFEYKCVPDWLSAINPTETLVCKTSFDKERWLYLVKEIKVAS